MNEIIGFQIGIILAIIALMLIDKIKDKIADIDFKRYLLKCEIPGTKEFNDIKNSSERYSKIIKQSWAQFFRPI